MDKLGLTRTLTDSGKMPDTARTDPAGEVRNCSGMSAAAGREWREEEAREMGRE